MGDAQGNIHVKGWTDKQIKETQMNIEITNLG